VGEEKRGKRRGYITEYASIFSLQDLSKLDELIKSHGDGRGSGLVR